MEVALRIIAIPNYFFVISVGLCIRVLDRIFSQIENFVYTVSADKLLVSPLSSKSAPTVLCTCFFFVICMSTVPAVLLLKSCSALEFCVATGLFLASIDAESFLLTIQSSLMCYLRIGTAKSWGGVKLGGGWRGWVPSFYCRDLCRYIANSGKILNFLLKIVCFGVGATSGYPLFEDVCLICITQLLSYAFILFVLVRPSILLYVHLKINQERANEHNNPPCGLHASARKRSRSCSVYEATYPERRPVSVQTVLQKTVRCADPLPTQHRIKCLTVVGLFLMYVHNFCFIKKDGSPDTSRLTLPAHCPVFSFYSGLYSTANRPPEKVWYAFHYTDLNLLLVLLAGILFYYRARLFAVQRGELLNLNVDNKEVSNFLDTANDVLTTSPSGLQIEKTVDIRTQLLGSGRSTQEAHPETKNIVDVSVITRDCLSRTNQIPSPGSSDNELLSRLAVGLLKTRELESVISNPTKAVELRRMDLCRLLSNPHVLERLPFRDYDYRFVNGQCCEEVIGYLPLPVGKVGPLLLDGHSHYIPLATTEGCLVASTNRGCRALFLAGGVNSVVFRDQMTRAPVVWFPSVLQVVECIAWIESAVGYQSLKTVFDRTSAHINLISVFPNPSGHYLHIRFAASTGDAMGMNMVSKATNSALHELQRHFPQMKVISLSGNMCTDKKPAAINTILGRGKSVLAEACLPATVLAQVLHTSASRLSRLAHAKNWIGSAMAGCPGMTGANAHAANIVAGIFAATGQDLAQVVGSSACLTQFEVGENDSLIATVTMPCLEVGTIGGGTRLPAQRACLDLMDLNVDCPTEHLSRLITGTVLAGELSLMAALDTDDLVSAHLRLNRAAVTPTSPTLPVNSDEVLEASKLQCVSRAATHLNGILAKSDASGRLEPPHPIM